MYVKITPIPSMQDASRAQKLKQTKRYLIEPFHYLIEENIMTRPSWFKLRRLRWRKCSFTSFSPAEV